MQRPKQKPKATTTNPEVLRFAQDDNLGTKTKARATATSKAKSNCNVKGQEQLQRQRQEQLQRHRPRSSTRTKARATATSKARATATSTTPRQPDKAGRDVGHQAAGRFRLRIYFSTIVGTDFAATSGSFVNPATKLR